MKNLNKYIVEKLKLSKDSVADNNLRAVTDEILLLCGWNFYEDGKGSYTSNHLDPTRDSLNAYVVAIDNWVHINNVEEYKAYGFKDEIKKVERHQDIIDMFIEDSELIEEIMDRMTGNVQAFSKYKVQINRKYIDNTIYMFTDENTLVFCDKPDKNEPLISRIFVKQ